MDPRPTAPDSDLFYETLLRSYVDAPRFIERTWLAERLEDSLMEPDCRFYLLTAEPGAGKTAFMAQLARQHPDWPRYFIRRDSQTPLSSGDARSFLFAVGHQLASLRPALFRPDMLEVVVRQRVGELRAGGKAVGIQVKDLRVSPFYQTALKVEQDVKIVAGELEGLSVERMVAEERFLELGNLLHLALLDPAQVLLKENAKARIVIVVDALDELRYYHGPDTVLDWLATCPELPSNVRFIVTSRPDEILDAFKRRQQKWLREQTIDPQAAQVQDDLRRYAVSFAAQESVKGALAEMKIVPDDFMTQAVTKAAGNFQYLVALSRGIEQAVEAGEKETLGQLLRFEDVPASLDELYAFFLTLIKQSVTHQKVEVEVPGAGPFDEPGYVSAWEGLYQPILGVLAVALEPLEVGQITGFGGIRAEDRWLQGAMGRLGQFLDHEDGRYRLYHSTFPEFLTSSETQATRPDCYLDPVEWHRRIARHSRGKAPSWEEVDWSRVDHYGLLHLAVHLYALRESEAYRQELYGLLCKSFMREKQARYGSHEPFAADLALVIKAAYSEEPPNLVQAIRSSLLYATLREVATNVPPEALGAVALMGQVERALGFAALMRDEEKKSTALRLIATALLALGQVERTGLVLLAALDMAKAKVGSERVRFIAEIALLAARIGNKDSALTFVDQVLAATQERWFDGSAIQTLSLAAQALAHAGEKDRALEVVNSALAQIEASLQLSELDAVIRALVEMGEKDRAVEAFNRAMALADMPSDRERDAATLNSLAMALIWLSENDKAAKLVQQALSALQAPEDTDSFWSCSMPETRYKIVQTLSRLGDAGLKQALEVAETIEDHDQKLEALSTIAAALAQAKARDEANRLVERVLAATQVTRDQNSTALKMYPEMVQALAEVGAIDKIAQFAEQLLALGKTIGEKNIQAATLSTAAQAFAKAGDHNKAMEAAHLAKAAIEHVELPARGLALVQDVALTAQFLTDLEDNRKHELGDLALMLAQLNDENGVKQILGTIERLGYSELQEYTLCRAARALMYVGEQDKAKDLAKRALSKLKRADKGERAGLQFTWVGEVIKALAEVGEQDKAKDLAKRALTKLKRADKAHRELLQFMGVGEVVQALAQAGEFDLAQSFTEGMTDDSAKASALCEIALALAQAGQNDTALEVAEQALIAWQQIVVNDDKTRDDKTRLMGLMVRICQRAGQQETAQSVFKSAVNAARWSGRETIFEMVKSGASTLAAMDQGQTLWRAYQAMLEVDSWWGSEGRSIY